MAASFDEINDCIRELHEASMHLRSAEFRSWALEHIRARVPFAAACWSVGSPDAIAAMHDVIAVGSEQRPSYAPDDGERESPRVVSHHESAGAQHMRVVLAFRRTPECPPFDAVEREALRWLSSQACTAWRNGEQRHLLRQVSRPNVATALADAAGCVHAVHGPFYAAVRASWPEWRQGCLPLPLRSVPRPGTVVSSRGQRWTVTASDGLLLITARPLGAVAALTARERTVAAAVLETGSQRLAATHLRISAHTVRNTLARVYTKLGVRGRVELAVRFRPELLRTVGGSQD